VTIQAVAAKSGQCIRAELRRGRDVREAIWSGRPQCPRPLRWSSRNWPRRRSRPWQLAVAWRFLELFRSTSVSDQAWHLDPMDGLAPATPTTALYSIAAEVTGEGRGQGLTW